MAKRRGHGTRLQAGVHLWQTVHILQICDSTMRPCHTVKPQRPPQLLRELNDIAIQLAGERQRATSSTNASSRRPSTLTTPTSTAPPGTPCCCCTPCGAACRHFNSGVKHCSWRLLYRVWRVEGDGCAVRVLLAGGVNVDGVVM
jgi:hypothetical protein